MRASRTVRLLLLFAIPVLSLLGAWPATAEDPLYDGLGQRPGIGRIAIGAVAIWRADARIRTDFDDIDPGRLANRLSDQICQLSGGPCVYRGRPMAESHAGLHVDQARFNAVVEGLQRAMDLEGVPYWTQNRLLARLAPMRRDIVTR